MLFVAVIDVWEVCMSDWKSDLNEFLAKEEEEKNTKEQREATQQEYKGVARKCRWPCTP